mmetsp:Transcript_38692/g.124336  ORF Transcript_38692/g.124336 Transcript_38692/m.124336 type:complete len:235 (+) Transcript_38692:455-1159(+)
MVAKGLPPRRTLLQRTSLVRQRLGLLLVSGRGYVRVGCVLLAQWTPASCVVPRFRCLDGRHAFLARVQRSLHRRLLYLSGVMLAFVLRHRAASGAPASTWLASATAAAFLGLFFIDPGDLCSSPWCVEHWLKRYGVLTPLFCLHVLGLPEGSDPLFRAFTMHPLPWLGELAYAIYAFQDPTVRLLKKCPGFDSSNSGAKVMIILGCLLPVAIVVQRYIQDPAGRWISHLAKRLA